MKCTILFILFIFGSATVFSQEKPTFTIGGGFPFFFTQNFDANSGGSHSMTYKRGSLFVEKPGLIEFSATPSISVTPGFAFFVFNENENGGGNGGGSSLELKHQAIGVYSKIIYENEHLKEDKDKWYFGLTAGYYLYSKTTGEDSWWLLQSHYSYGSETIDTSGKKFFNSFYFGVLGGLRLPVKAASPTVKPVIEFSFYPRYANIPDSYISEDEQKTGKSMMMLSLLFEINTKKAAQN